MEVHLELPTNQSGSNKAIFNVLKATLEYPANPQTKGRKLAGDIVFFCKSAEDGDPPFWEIWPMFLALASNIPPNHEWQTSLIESLNILRQMDVSSNADFEIPALNELPDLSISVAEYWNSLDNPSNHSPPESKVIQKWQNLNSFLARFSSYGFAPWLSLVIWQLQEALEEPPMDESHLTHLETCRIWVASEWIVHCGSLIYKAMKPEDDNEQQAVLLDSKGSLCSDIPSRSIKRWEFWKMRLSQVEGDAFITSKIHEALVAMKNVDQESS